jgi:putative nucleotidyltransferase with HDIG domain
MIKNFVFVLLLLAVSFVYSVQSHPDSLESAIYRLKGQDRIDALNQLAELYLRSTPRKSIELAHSAQQASNELRYQAGSAAALQLLGEAHFQLGNYQSALRYQMNALQISENMDDANRMVRSLNNIGRTHLRLFNYDKALTSYLQALRLERRLGNNLRMLQTLHQIAEIYQKMNELEKSQNYYLEALLLEEKIGSTSSLVLTLNSLGSVYLAKGDFTNAIENFKRALLLEQNSGNLSGIATANFNLGKTYAKLKDYDRALEHFDRSLDLTLELGSKYEISQTFVYIGDIYIDTGRLDLAFANLTQGIQIAMDLDARELLRDAYYSFYQYYSKSNNIPRALQYYQLFAREKEHLIKEETERQMLELQAGFEYLDSEREIALLQKEQVIGKLTSDKRKLFNLLMITGFIAILFATVIIYFRLRQKNITNKELRVQIAEKEKAEQQLLKRLIIEKTVSGISSDFIKTGNFNKVIKISLENIGKICNANKASLFLITADRRFMERLHHWTQSDLGIIPPSLEMMEIERNKWWFDQLETKDIVSIDDVSMMNREAYHEQNWFQQQDVKSALAFPIRFKNKLIGFVEFVNFTKSNKWHNEDFALLSLYSETIGFFFERKEMEDRLRNANAMLEKRVQERTQELAEANQELQLEVAERKHAQQELNDSYYRLKKAMEETINALISAVEIRDPYTAGHQLRVAALSREIGLAMGLKKEQLDSIRIAAILHDIGKIYVPTEILTKPARLTDAEYGMIKNHPLAGYDILKTIDFELPVAKIVYQHHERLNGSGYPQGLIGNEIMLEARIVNVADVVDAMISQRPYRSSQGIEEALAELNTNAGIIYDEKIVNICIDLFHNGFQFEDIRVRASRF